MWKYSNKLAMVLSLMQPIWLTRNCCITKEVFSRDFRALCERWKVRELVCGLAYLTDLDNERYTTNERFLNFIDLDNGSTRQKNENFLKRKSKTKESIKHIHTEKHTQN